MSGSDLAYHLRPNKAIDRNLFIALLERVARVKNISEYEYIGFGGPMLEDYKALHASLRINKMHSIERNEQTFKRQKFNKPAAFIKLHHKESGEFFRTHQFASSGTIVWLDYTSAKDLKSQLDELVNVICKLDIFDVVKVTLNASLKNWGGEELPTEERAQARLEKLRAALGEYVPDDVVAKDMTTTKYSSTLQRIVKSVVSGLPSTNGTRYFQILTSFSYADGQPMLTITGIVFSSSDAEERAHFIRASRLEHWPFANLNWASPQGIAVPALTAKERMKLDEKLPLIPRKGTSAKDRLKAHLGYQPSDSDGDALDHYAKYYRVYPHFSRVII